jgi:hypothetical protein
MIRWGDRTTPTWNSLSFFLIFLPVLSIMPTGTSNNLILTWNSWLTGAPLFHHRSLTRSLEVHIGPCNTVVWPVGGGRPAVWWQREDNVKYGPAGGGERKGGEQGLRLMMMGFLPYLYIDLLLPWCTYPTLPSFPYLSWCMRWAYKSLVHHAGCIHPCIFASLLAFFVSVWKQAGRWSPPLRPPYLCRSPARASV